MKQKKKLPEFVYITRTNEGTDDEYLDVHIDPKKAVEDDGPTVVGTYQLTDTNKLTKHVVSTPVKK